MKYLGQIFEFLKTTGDKPEPFGGFHIFSLVLTVLVTAAVCGFIKAPDEKTVRRLLLAVSITVIVLEIYKQTVYSFSFDGEKFSFSYKWHIFPWQFCSTPMLAGLGAAVIKDQRIHRSLCAYLATYGLAAGLVTMLSGSSLFSDIVGINIQTMVCHGSMVVVGVFLLKSGHVKSNAATLSYAVWPMLAGAVCAMILNEAAYLIGIPEGQVFNMYFISPYFPEDVPILTPFRRLLPDPLFQIAYLAAFSGLAALILYISRKIEQKNEPKR